MADERPFIQDEAVELVARAILRETIEHSGWYPNLIGEKRRKRIEEDVDQNWHLMMPDARKRLEERG
jgi:hypothetical protein